MKYSKNITAKLPDKVWHNHCTILYAGLDADLGSLEFSWLSAKTLRIRLLFPITCFHIGSCRTRCFAMAHYHLPRRRTFQLIFNNPTLLTRPPLRTRAYSAPPVPPHSSRWLSDLKARLGRCIIFGLPKEQIGQAGQAAKVLGQGWRGLIAGREGYLIDSGQEGTVRWGEMVRRS